MSEPIEAPAQGRAGQRPGEALLRLRDLRVGYHLDGRRISAVDGVDLDVMPGEALGLVGESGSGKSTLALAIPQLVQLSGGHILAGSITLDGTELVGASPRTLQTIRGRAIGMVFQQPLSSLNPVMTIGSQLTEGLRRHLGCPPAEAEERAIGLLRDVRLPAPAELMRRYPHELSGGMRQRVVIAIALSCRPKLLIADEPTTALDVTVQAQILELLRGEARRLGLATIFVTHDIAVVSALADRIGVMYAGQLVEIGPAQRVITAPMHPYSWALLNARPQLGEARLPQTIPGSAPRLDRGFTGCRFVERCPFRAAECAEHIPPLTRLAPDHAAACWHAGRFERALSPDATLPAPTGRRERAPRVLVSARGLSKSYVVQAGGGPRRLPAVDNVDIDVVHGETLGLVGESGCGKSTLGRLMIRLVEPTSGSVRFDGEDLSELSGQRLRRMRAHMQIVFQNPASALNPRQTVRRILAAPRAVQGLSAGAQGRSPRELLELVGLDAQFEQRYPHQLSGGQKQRVAIARALALDPPFLVCDEPLSALDVSTQAQIIALIRDLQQRLGLTLLFISHDLATVQTLSDRVAVMYLGALVEIGTVEQVFGQPSHPYTRMLLDAVPRLRADGEAGHGLAGGEPPSPLAMPSGCRFHPRCAMAVERCRVEPPALREVGRRLVACHLATAPLDPGSAHADVPARGHSLRGDA